MTIFGKPFLQYVSYVRWFSLLILAVGISRLVLSLIGMPNTTTRLFSMSVLMAGGTIYYGFRVHSSGFGSYLQLIPVIAIPNVIIHVVSITGIVIGILTGEANVFTAPEYAFGGDGRTWTHVGMHLVVGMIAGALVNWLIACVFLFLSRTFLKRSNAPVRV